MAVQSVSLPGSILLHPPRYSFRLGWRSHGFLPSLSNGSSGVLTCQGNTVCSGASQLSRKCSLGKNTRTEFCRPPRSTGSSSSGESSEDSDSSKAEEKVPFGYSRKDVLLIGVGVTLLGIGLESGLEFVGVDPLKAGNAVQLILVLGLTIGWISTYIFRVSNKDMTYAKQLKDYEYKVMEKRLEGLTEAELQVLMEQVEEEKGRKVEPF